MIPENLKVVIKKGTWPVLPVFQLMQELGDIPERDMYNTFNMGIGMVMAVAPEIADAVILEAERLGEKAYLIGEVAEGKEIIEIC